MKYESLKKLKLPDSPGVYFFLKSRKVIYIGKATSLKTRTQSYFREDLAKTRGPITAEMILRADGIKWEETSSVLEALILEANLIKKHQPYYNVKEKDNKSFLCVLITKEAVPRLVTMRSRNLAENNSWKNIKVSKIFGPFTSGPQLREALKIVRRIFPFLDEKYKNNYRFYRQVELVPDISSREGILKYKNNIKNLKLFFEGKKKQVVRNLEKEMRGYAKKREFEKAGEVKRQLFALKHINDVALLSNENFAGNRFFSGPRFSGAPTPARPFTKAIAGEVRIEAYDIAHMGGKNMTGVMVAVIDGEAVKNEYRKFKIKTQLNANDTGALAEVLERRLAHAEWPYPGLVVVDGSTAQINTAKKVLVKMGKLIPVVSVVKDERHKPKDIMGDEGFAEKYKKEILLANSEAHRFAIAYHKNMRNKNFLK